ncbi:hypothetical protein ABIE87_006499 [Bradyrhizobium diazoefficiens]
MADYAAWGDDRDEIEIDDGGPYNVKEYPEREIFRFRPVHQVPDPELG